MKLFSGLSVRGQGWLLAALVFAFDQLSKLVLRTHIVPEKWDVLVITPFFNLNHAWNYGVSFSLFADAGDWRRIKLVVLALALSALVAYWLHRTSSKMQALAYGMIIGGALGNVCDRLVHGAVFDFLQFHLAEYYWPSFNLADSAIVVGVGLLLWDSWKGQKHQHEVT